MTAAGRPLELFITGTDTGVGKTRVTGLLVQGLRRLGRRVWVHKPVACGGWDGASSEDGRALRALAGDGQPAETICPREFPEPASPHLAAAAAGRPVSLAELRATVAALRGDHDLIVEGAGGLLTPLCRERIGLMELAEFPLLIVARPHLGTLNHSALTARAAGVRALGLVLNRHESLADALAVRHVAAELPAVTGLPLVADLPFGEAAAGDPLTLATATLAAAGAR